MIRMDSGTYSGSGYSQPQLPQKLLNSGGSGAGKSQRPPERGWELDVGSMQEVPGQGERRQEASRRELGPASAIAAFCSAALGSGRRGQGASFAATISRGAP